MLDKPDHESDEVDAQGQMPSEAMVIFQGALSAQPLPAATMAAA
jgi:hypothetical protein